jgi:hypothetical protein
MTRRGWYVYAFLGVIVTALTSCGVSSRTVVSTPTAPPSPTVTATMASAINDVQMLSTAAGWGPPAALWEFPCTERIWRARAFQSSTHREVR